MKTLVAFLMGILLLPSCAEDTVEIVPCATCPEDAVVASVACDPCAVKDVIDVTIDNRSDKTLTTSICQWRLLNSTSDGLEFVQQLDCTTIRPVPIEIEPRSSVILGVSLDPEQLPPLTNFRNFRIEVTVQWLEDELAPSAELLTGRFALTN